MSKITDQLMKDVGEMLVNNDFVTEMNFDVLTNDGAVYLRTENKLYRLFLAEIPKGHSTKQAYLVTLPRVEGVTRTRVMSYMKDAIQYWGGQFDPDNDPLFYAYDKGVRIKSLGDI